MRNVLRVSFFFILLLSTNILFAQDKDRLRSSLKLLETTTNDTLKVKYLDDIGWDTSYDNLTVGLKYCLQALELAEQIKYEKGISHSCNSIGTIYQDMGDANKALAFLLRALRVAEKNNNSTAIATSCMNIASVYTSQDDYTNSLKFLLRAKKISEELKDSHSLAAIYSNLGNIYFAFPDSTAKAIEYYKKSIIQSNAIHRTDGVANALAGLAKCDQKLGDTINSDFEMNRAIYLMDSMQVDYEVSQFKVNYAILLTERGHYTKAEKLLHEALLIYRKIGMIEQEKDLWSELADFYEKSGQLQKSVTAWKRFSKLKDSLLNENVLRHQRDLETVYETQKKENEIKLLTQKATLSKTITIALIGGCLLLLLILFVLFKRSQLRKETNIQLEKQNAIIEEKNKDITDSINYARRIQDAVLPPPGLMKMRFSDAFVFYRPRDIVSGDFWWTTEKNGKFIVACADCTGHGVPGGFMSVMSAAFLSEIVNEKGITEPEMILAHLRRKVISALNKSPEQSVNDGQDESKSESVRDGMDIVVCSFSDENKFDFACANNPLWVIRKKSLTIFPPDKFPVGVYHGEIKPFTKQSTQIVKGDMIYLFSDGLADQFGGQLGRKFKYKQFQELLISISEKSGKEQQQILQATLDNWKGNLEQVDDILIIGIRI